MDMNFDEVFIEHDAIMNKAFALLDEAADRIGVLIKIKELQSQIIDRQNERIDLLTKKCEMLERVVEKSGLLPSSSN